MPLIISLQVATLATVVAFFAGIALAYFVDKLRRGKTLVDAIIMLPMVLPPTVVGFFLLLVLGKRSPIGQALLQLDITFVFTFKAAVIAAAVVSLPLMYRTTRGAFDQIDSNILNAARTLGISEWNIFWRVLLPNAKHGILAGLVLTFTRALGEFGATLMFAGNVPGKTQTLSTAIYAAVQANDYQLACQWALLLTALSLSFIAFMNHAIKNPRP